MTGVGPRHPRALARIALPGMVTSIPMSARLASCSNVPGATSGVCSGGREVVEWTYRGDAQTCQACPLREKCTTSKKSGRSVQRSEHEDLIIANRAWMETV